MTSAGVRDRSASSVTDVRISKERLPSFVPGAKIDTADAIIEEQAQGDKKVKHTLHKWLIFIFFMAFLRLFLINVVMID